MDVEWFCQLMGEEVGPLTTAQLIEMAKKHQIDPVDMVRKGRKRQWVPASKIKGLFEEEAAPPSELWYFLYKGKKIGPMVAEKMKKHALKGRLKDDTRVWSTKMPKWVSAKDLDWLELD